MDLFGQRTASEHNLLPFDGHAEYHGPLFPQHEADTLMRVLQETAAWRYDEVRIHGRHIVTQRQVAWYADQAVSYTYSGVARTALPWPEDVLTLKTKVEDRLGERFNSCLLNRYKDGSVGMGWHADAERELVKNGTIASLSFGAQRQFRFRHRATGKTLSLDLEHGSLLVMKGETQSHWQHALPKTTRIKTPRINLTFRQYG